MKQLTCEMCGSTDMLKEDGVFVCQSCGTKYSVEEAKKLMIEGTVEVQGTVKVDKSNEIETLLKRAFILLEDGDSKTANEYFEKVLAMDPDNAKAYLGKFMWNYSLKKLDDIKKLYKDITKSTYLERAIRFADTELKNVLTSYVDYFNKNIQPLLIQLEPFSWEKLYNGTIKIEKFYGQGLKHVTIPNIVTEIGDSAFNNSSGEELTSVIIPDSVTYIGDWAFAGCRNLADIIIPNSVTHIGRHAFCQCFNLTSITLPSSITCISEYMFADCQSLAKVIIPDSVTEIGNTAFGGCTSLLKIKIPKGVERIDSSTFENCTNLEVISLPSTISYIDGWAFQDCKAIKSITIDDIPVRVNCIGSNELDYAFYILDYPNIGIHTCAFKGCIGSCFINITNTNNTSSSNKTNSASSRSSTSSASATSSTSSAKSGCYVATCVYGSYDCPQVWMLRRFRDDTLGATWYGRLFIRAYYAVSPTLVKWFGKTNWFKKLWRGKLDRMVAKLQNNGVEDTPYEDKNW